MSGRAILALTRAAWYQARSYRLALAMQVGGLLITVVPLYFIARALQPTMANTIADESPQFFAFVLVGSVALMFVTTAMTVLQAAIGGGITTGYFEALLMTRARMPSILAGMTSYGLTLTAVRAVIMLTAGWILGAQIAWSRGAEAMLILALLVAVHWGVGLVAAALVLAFRTSGPLLSVVSMVSIFFGGVYYPVSAIPSWLGAIAKVTPLAYGLTALRRVLLKGDGLFAVAGDVAILALMGVVALTLGGLAMRVALRYAQRAGSLGTY